MDLTLRAQDRRCDPIIIAACRDREYHTSQFENNSSPSVAGLGWDFLRVENSRLIIDVRDHDDAKFSEVLGRLLTTAVSCRRGVFQCKPVGIIQGSGHSPLLCNVDLHKVYECFAAESHAGGIGVHCFRHADNILMLSRAVGLLSLRRAQKALLVRRPTQRTVIGE